jgi:hypothetical protein
MVEMGSISPASVGEDLAKPTVGLLRDVQLLPEEGQEQNGFESAFTGPHPSVALLEAGLTAGAKWWAAGGSAVLLGIWGAVKVFWGENPEVRDELVWAAALASTAIIVGIAWLLTSDLRARAAVQVATIAARAAVAEEMVRIGHHEAAKATKPAASKGTVTPFPGGTRAKYRRHRDDPETIWLALASLSGADGSSPEQYYLVKGHEHLWAPADDVSIVVPMAEVSIQM